MDLLSQIFDKSYFSEFLIGTLIAGFVLDLAFSVEICWEACNTSSKHL